MAQIRSDNANDREFIAIKDTFKQILEHDHNAGPYATKVQKMIREDATRLIVNLNDVRQLEDAQNIVPPLTQRLLQHPVNVIPAMETALNDYVQSGAWENQGYNNDGLAKKQTKETYTLGFSGSFGRHRVVPCDLNSRHLSHLVCVEGIVSKASFVKPKRVKTVHYCEEVHRFTEHYYRDSTSFAGQPTGSAIPKVDDAGRPVSIEFGYSEYENFQRITLQDMPERVQIGKVPRTIEVHVASDLVDACKTGDRVQIIGVYRALGWKISGGVSGMFRTVIIANNVRKMADEESDRDVSHHDIVSFGTIAHRPDVFELFARSMAPALYGHEYIKRALVLLLLGGEEKILENKTHIRGDINMLMVGDPSVGKSQLLRFVLQVAKLAIPTTGRGSSGVGLTAAVVHDRDSGERFLEAGAMVLADRGIVCIDEFDKMSEMDRTAIHEVMEQQTVTIAKAGIHTSLNARCSVIAAANPIYGSYDVTRKPKDNIALPDSILSRFDFLFLVLDKLDPELDRNISDHVLRMHRYKRPNYDMDDEFDEERKKAQLDKEGTTVFEKPNALLHGTKKNRRGETTAQEYLTIEFLKKFIAYIKHKYHPRLTDESSEIISKAYADLRCSEQEQTMPITARCLETLIRLSTAHAKLRMRKEVEKEDCEVALELLNFALSNDAQMSSNNRGGAEDSAGNDQAADAEDDSDDSMSMTDLRGALPRARRGGKKKRLRRNADAMEDDDDDVERKHDFGDGDEDEDDDFRPSGGSRKRSQSSRGSSAVAASKRARSSRSRGSALMPPSPQSQSSSSAPMEDEDDVPVRPDRKRFITKVIAGLTRNPGAEGEALLVAKIRDTANAQSPKKPYSQAEINALLSALQKENKIMVDQGQVYRV